MSVKGPHTATSDRYGPYWRRYLVSMMTMASILVLLVTGLVMSRENGRTIALALSSGESTTTGTGASTVALTVPRTGMAPVHFLQMAPPIRAGATVPHGPRGPCRSCHRIVTDPAQSSSSSSSAVPAAAPLQAAQAGPIPDLNMLPLQEAHWQGLELITLTPGMARVLNIPRHARGVVIDEATMPADLQGFVAGDLVTAVDGLPTPDLESFVLAAERVMDRGQAQIQVLRQGQPAGLVLSALTGRLGNANGETAPMIEPGARSPHGYLGPCTNCHHIGTNMNLAVDVGDTLAKTAPVIQSGQTRPHRDRGECSACHTIR